MYRNRRAVMTLDDIMNAGDPREIKRALAVKMFEHGLSRNQISTILSISESYVTKWNSIYRKTGEAGLLLGYTGSEGYLDAFDYNNIIKYIESKESITVEELAAYITENFGVSYSSKQSYYNLLHEAGMSHKKTEKVNPKHNEAAVLEKREEIKKNFMKTKMILSQIVWLCWLKMSATWFGKMRLDMFGPVKENLFKFP